MKNPRTRTCAYFILIWIWRGRWLITGQWSPLSHASHCLTTSRPAAATQTRVRVKPPPYNPRYFLHLPQSSLFLGSGTCSKCAGLRILVRQHIMRNFLAVNDSTYSHGNWQYFIVSFLHLYSPFVIVFKFTLFQPPGTPNVHGKSVEYLVHNFKNGAFCSVPAIPFLWL